MIERLVSEIKSRHDSKPITKSQHDRWKASAVTKRLHEDLELAVLDSFQDYLPEDKTDEIAVQAMLRQGAAQMVELVLDWEPKGLEKDDDE